MSCHGCCGDRPSGAAPSGGAAVVSVLAELRRVGAVDLCAALLASDPEQGHSLLEALGAEAHAAAAASAMVTAEGAPEIAPGAEVEAHSLRGAAELNGLCGVVRELGDERACVDFGPPHGLKRIRPQNLRATGRRRAPAAGGWGGLHPVPRSRLAQPGDSLEPRDGEEQVHGAWRAAVGERCEVVEVRPTDAAVRLRNSSGAESGFLPARDWQWREGEPLLPRYEESGDAVAVAAPSGERLHGTVTAVDPLRVRTADGAEGEYTDAFLVLEPNEVVQYQSEEQGWQICTVVSAHADGSADIMPHQSGQGLLRRWPEQALRRRAAPQRSQWFAQVQQWLRGRVSHGVDGRVPGEELCFPGQGTGFEDYAPGNTVSVDSFLYGDDAVVDEMVEQGRLTRAYCADCGSLRCRPANFISHSMSLPQLRFLFEATSGDSCAARAFAEGELRGKRLVDVGSRAGAVLWAASRMRGHELASVTGVELSPYWCAVQRDCVARFAPRGVTVVEGDCFGAEGSAALRAADVLVLNNVFQWFSAPERQREQWLKLRGLLRGRAGVTVISVPSLETLLAPCGLDPAEWMEPVPLEYPEEGEEAEMDEDAVEACRLIHKYSALGT